mmetsp:Transcript_133/g.227  ORF Transcript_133/g.227 Transcript_133/m.227 type:complete len:486 (+) Transcript_133:142-1599(+)
METVIYGNCFIFGSTPPPIQRKTCRWNTKRHSPWEKISNEEETVIEAEIQPLELQFNTEHIDLQQIKDIQIAHNHMLILLENGYLYSVGNGLNGKLGHGETSHCDEPVKVMNNVTSISVGKNHSAAITSEGCLYMMGLNEYGQLGLSHFNDVYTPTLVSFFKEPVAQVACGENHTLVLLESGNAYAFGRGMEGQLGTLGHIKATEERTAFSPVSNRKMYLLKRPTPRLVNAHYPADKNHRRPFVTFSTIACGQNFSNLISKQGHLFVCGEGRTGALGVQPFQSQVLSPTHVDIEPQEAVKGEKARLINVSIDYEPLPSTKIQPRYIDHEEPEAPPPEKVKPVIKFDLDIQYREYDDVPSVEQVHIDDIVSAFGHTLLLTTSGKLYASGLNTHGQCGVGHQNTLKVFTPLKMSKSLQHERILKIGVGTHFSAFLTDAGYLYVTGLLPGKTQPFLIPTRLFHYQHNQQSIQNFFCGPSSIIVLTDQQ